jgi:hypothetical protein
MACPGSIRLIDSLPVDVQASGESFYAREGTAAHALAEKVLSNRNTAPGLFIGMLFGGVEVTEEMADYVQIFTDYCSALMNDSEVRNTWVEKRFTLAKLNPPDPMFGTADFVAYNNGVLEVVDLKYGAGVVVDVYENEQLLYYALGALIELGLVVDTIKVTIVQPRTTHKDGIIRSFSVTFDELMAFTNRLMAAAKRTKDADAPLVPGSHCRFCPANALCPALRKTALEVAQVEFGTVDVPPDPEVLPEALFEEMLPKLHVLESWIKSMYGRAERRLLAGESVTGYKLVARRANRSWVSEEETKQWLAAKGISPEDYLKQELKSPAQIEKVVGKKNLPTDLTQKVSSGYTMVPEADARPAASLSAGSEFTLLPPEV